MLRKDGKFRLLPLFGMVLVAAILSGALVSAALGAYKAPANVARPRLVPYPKLSEEQVSGISTLFDPQLPFNENVPSDAFQDRAGLDATETQAAFNAPVAKIVTANGPTVPASGYALSGTPYIPTATAPTATPPGANAPAPPAQSEEERRARIEALRKTGKFGTKDEASLYNWRDCVPLGIVGFGNDKNGQPVREVYLKSTLTGRAFVARRNTKFADATLAEVTTSGVVFQDSAGRHEVGWSRKQGARDQSGSPQTIVQPAPVVERAPSGYADSNSSTQARRLP